MNNRVKYAEIEYRNRLFHACRGILRVKQGESSGMLKEAVDIIPEDYAAIARAVERAQIMQSHGIPLGRADKKALDIFDKMPDMAKMKVMNAGGLNLNSYRNNSINVSGGNVQMKGVTTGDGSHVNQDMQGIISNANGNNSRSSGGPQNNNENSGIQIGSGNQQAFMPVQQQFGGGGAWGGWGGGWGPGGYGPGGWGGWGPGGWGPGGWGPGGWGPGGPGNGAAANGANGADGSNGSNGSTATTTPVTPSGYLYNPHTGMYTVTNPDGTTAQLTQEQFQAQFQLGGPANNPAIEGPDKPNAIEGPAKPNAIEGPDKPLALPAPTASSGKPTVGADGKPVEGTPVENKIIKDETTGDPNEDVIDAEYDYDGVHYDVNGNPVGPASGKPTKPNKPPYFDGSSGNGETIALGPPNKHTPGTSLVPSGGGGSLTPSGDPDTGDDSGGPTDADYADMRRADHRRKFVDRFVKGQNDKFNKRWNGAGIAAGLTGAATMGAGGYAAGNALAKKYDLQGWKGNLARWGGALGGALLGGVGSYYGAKGVDRASRQEGLRDIGGRVYDKRVRPVIKDMDPSKISTASYTNALVKKLRNQVGYRYYNK